MTTHLDDNAHDVDSIPTTPRRLPRHPIVIALISMLSTLAVVLIVIQITSNDDESANDATKNTVNGDSTDVPTLVQESVDLINNQKYSEAINVLNEAAKIDPANPLIFYNIGVAQHFSNDLGAAEDSYSKALSLDNRLSFVYYNRGLVRRDRGNLRDAVADLQIATALDSTNAATHYNLGQVLASLGETAASETAIAEARRLDPDIGK